MYAEKVQPLIHMSTIRSFIAVEIDPVNKQKLSSLISLLKQSNADIKWVNETQMHLTLKFLGNIEEKKVQQISAALKVIADNFSAFNMHFSKIGAFPNMTKPRVIWLGIDKGADSLKLLNSKIEDELEKIGIEKERRAYAAHLTLGRVKSLKNISILANLINETNFEAQGETKIDELILFQSTLTPKGAIYTPISRFNLGQ